MAIISLISSYVLLSIIHITLSSVHVYDDLNISVDNFDDETASFGPPFPAKGFQGYITTTNPINGCKKMSPPPNIPTSKYKWIALIPRTTDQSCEFALKIQNAQNANFSAVIIYNYDDSLITMGSSGKNVLIPSTLITYTSGSSLIAHYLYNKTSVNSTPIYHVKIVPEETFPMSAYLIPVSVVIVFLFLALIGFVLVKFCIQRRRALRHRLPQSALKKLKTKKFVKDDPWDTCAICLDDYEEGAKLRILPCDHAYHMKCIDPWLINNRRQCPVCKRYVFPDHDNSDDEGNVDHQQTRTSTEQTPLVQSNDNNNSTTDMPTYEQLNAHRVFNASSRGIHNVSFASNESSNNVENLSSLTRPTSTNHTTTTAGLDFDRPSSNSRRYGSMNDSSITPRGANFFVGSLGGTTDNTNVSLRSALEDVSDIEEINDDDDGQIQSAITCSEANPAYVDDEGSMTNAIRSHL